MPVSTKLDQRLIGYITTFETITRCHAKDIVLSPDGLLLFIVPAGEGGRAIWRKGMHVAKLRSLLKKSIKIVEFSEAVEEFVAHIIDPVVADEIVVGNGVVKIMVKDGNSKGKLIGRGGKNLKLLQKLVEAYFSMRVMVA